MKVKRIKRLILNLEATNRRLTEYFQLDDYLDISLLQSVGLKVAPDQAKYLRKLINWI